MADIKKVIQRLYQFDLKNCELEDGNEMISTDHGNEFVNTFIKRDLDNGVIITPTGYTKGLVYKSTNNGEFYNNPDWIPDVVSFSFNMFGLKKNSFYRITVKSRNSRRYNRLLDTTEDRSLIVSDDNEELLINKDLSEELITKEYSAIFRASSTECNLYFKIGKIYITDIILDEVLLVSEDKPEVEATKIEFDTGKSNIVGFGVFSCDNINLTNANTFTEIPRITGKGLLLFVNKKTNTYYLERDNKEDSIGGSFTSASYIVNFNFNKAPHASYIIEDASTEISPNSLKQGYISFKILENGVEKIYQHSNGRLTFLVEKVL